MQLYDVNARRQIIREHVDELARDARRMAKAEQAAAERARPALLRRRPARAAVQRP